MHKKGLSDVRDIKTFFWRTVCISVNNCFAHLSLLLPSHLYFQLLPLSLFSVVISIDHCRHPHFSAPLCLFAGGPCNAGENISSVQE